MTGSQQLEVWLRVSPFQQFSCFYIYWKRKRGERGEGRGGEGEGDIKGNQETWKPRRGLKTSANYSSQEFHAQLYTLITLGLFVCFSSFAEALWNPLQYKFVWCEANLFIRSSSLSHKLVQRNGPLVTSGKRDMLCTGWEVHIESKTHPLGLECMDWKNIN